MAATLTQLRDRARYRGDFESDANITDAILTVWANESVLELWDIVAAAYQDHVVTSVDFPLVGGTVAASQLALPAAVYQVRMVEKNPDTTARYELAPYQLGAKNALACLSYRVMGGVLQIEPVELAAGNYRMHYLSTPTVLVNAGDALDARLGPWEEYVSVSMAIKACVRQERPSQDLMLALAAIKARVQAMAPARMSGRPAITRDVYAVPAWPYWWGP